jgi:hypothetical protein
MITTSPEEIQLLKQISNGFKYFNKYIYRLSHSHPDFPYQHCISVRDFCAKQSIILDSHPEGYNFSIWSVILKDMQLLQKEYDDLIGLSPVLYTEFLENTIRKIKNTITNIYEKINHEMTV